MDIKGRKRKKMKATIKINNIRVQRNPISDNKGNYSSEDNAKKFRLRNTSRYVVGIIYEDFGGEMGFFDFWDDNLSRIKERALDIMTNGHFSYPSIPVTSCPRIVYLYDTKEDKDLRDLLKNKEKPSCLT